MDPRFVQFVSTFSSPTFIIAAASLTAIIAAHVGMLAWLRRQEAREAARPKTQEHRTTRWLLTTVADAVPPLLLLTWIQGGWIGARLFTDQFAASNSLDRSLLVLRWCHAAATTAGLCWLLARLGRRLELLFASWSIVTTDAWDDVLLPLGGRLVRRALPLMAFLLGGAALAPTPALARTFQDASTLTIIGFIAWGLSQIVEAAAAVVLRRHRIDVADNLQARAIHTQILVLKKAARTVIAIFTLASMLMVFDSARQLGGSILASAGIAGIVVGLAAQKSIATLLAGFQIALTQPIRVDDVVIVEGEWGRIEDITLTYVVVKIWDLRRLVVPITYFIEHPFQNWTRSSSAVLGTVFLHVDYNAPIDALRAELTRILSTSNSWDGAVNVLQVTDAKEHTLELRALASAADASSAWNLRCEVREQLVAFLQRHHPESLPILRAAIEQRTSVPSDPA